MADSREFRTGIPGGLGRNLARFGNIRRKKQFVYSECEAVINDKPGQHKPVSRVLANGDVTVLQQSTLLVSYLFITYTRLSYSLYILHTVIHFR